MSQGGSAAEVYIHFVQVGQGDSTLVVDHDSHEALLIDCPVGKESAVESLLLAAGSPSLKAVVLTHWDRDHYGGVLEIIRSSKAEFFYYNHDTIMAWDEKPNLRRAALLELVADDLLALQRKAAERGMGGTLGKRTSWRMLAPYHDDLTRGIAIGDRNYCSGIVEVMIGANRFLIGGDADGRIWARLRDAGDDLRSLVLRWPHHGALNPTGGVDEAELFALTDPQNVVISVGTRNQHRHPQPVAIGVGSQARLACTEVTGKCDDGERHPSGTACGGNLSFLVDANDQVFEAGGWLTLDSTVDGWLTPMCRGNFAGSSE